MSAPERTRKRMCEGIAAEKAEGDNGKVVSNDDDENDEASDDL